MQLTSMTDNRPYINVIFGNFYRPAFDDEAFVDETMGLIKSLGFNSVMFDTKAWEDFRERYETGALSQYVKMQEYMGKSAHRHGLSYNFLLLYLNGDNLYPHIRFSPPILGEGIQYPDGTPGRWYKYWSPKARASMKEHVDRIMERYGMDCERCLTGVQENVIPVCSMWDPVVAPSFDAEGQTRYREFLREFYHGDIEKLNRNYGIAAADFEALTPQEYWYGVRYEKQPFYTEEDVEKRTPPFYLWRDNMFWKIQELTLYFQAIGPMLKEKNPELFLCPDMTQWGYFLNIYGRTQMDMDNEFSDLWDTAMRGIDIYALAPYVDSCHFITVPVTPDGYPDAYVVSCQHSMMRVMNEGKPLIGGIYWGRYIYNDLYALLSPAEIIGSMTACGMDGYTCYGMNGLDDGGVMNRMDADFLDSLRRANAWCSEIIPLRRGARVKEVAILFPSEMAHLEPYEVGNNKIRRLDLLGWYKLCCDLGYQTDVISSHEIERGILDAYKILIVPANNCYFAVEHEVMERKIRDWVLRGGVFLHGPGDELARNCFGIEGEECKRMPYRYGKTIIAQGERFCRYHGGKEIAPYVDCCDSGESGVKSHAEESREASCTECHAEESCEASYTVFHADKGGCCVAEYDGSMLAEFMGKAGWKTSSGEILGTVYSFGVQIGASYASKNIPHVPYEQGNREMYPISLSGTTLVRDILYRYLLPASGICERGIETGVFENGMIIVNHRPVPYMLPRKYRTELYQYPFHAVHEGRGVLAAHEAVWVSEDEADK